MNKKVAGILSIGIIIICIGYIIYDIATGRSDSRIISEAIQEEEPFETNWIIDNGFKVIFGELTSIEYTSMDLILCAGDSFLACYNSNFELQWNKTVDETIYALAESGGIIYAAGQEEIMVFDSRGELIEKWGPYDDGALITSISANKDYVAIADAGNQLVFVCDRKGALKSIVGHPGTQFIVPSAYFDVVITSEDTLLIANTGKRSIEFRTIDGKLVRAIGEEGDEFEYFCGCCNPSHIDITEDGDIVTAEKGINRLKILRTDGTLLEPIAQPEYFKASIPLDISVGKNNIIYAANRQDSKIYVFTRLDY